MIYDEYTYNECTYNEYTYDEYTYDECTYGECTYDEYIDEWGHFVDIEKYEPPPTQIQIYKQIKTKYQEKRDNEIDEWTRTQVLYKIDETDEIDELDKLDQIDQIDQIDYIFNKIINFIRYFY